MPSVETSHGAIFYTDIGQANNAQPPLLLIHGAAASHLVWPACLRRFKAQRVLSLDLPGHGRSAQKGVDRIEDYAAAVVAFLEAIGVETALVVGHSMGGAIAQQLALDAAERIAGIVLVGTGPVLRVNPRILELARTEPETVADMIVKWAWSRTASTDKLQGQDREQILATPPEVLYGDYLACDHFDSRGRLAEIQMPTLVIGGSVDKMTPPALSETLAELIQTSTLVTVTDGGHMMMLEQPTVVCTAISNWIAEQFTP
jgi:pimeloyl-ACP methyl ester carboxylesterase